MFKLLVIATVVAVAIADVQPAIEALKTAIDNLDIPDERKALYKPALTNRRNALKVLPLMPDQNAFKTTSPS